MSDNELVVNKQQHLIKEIYVPQNFDQALKLASMISNSSLCPTNFKGKAEDVFIAMQMGAEIGLSPMQAIQNICVINGKPCVYGDAAIAVVRVHSQCESIKEWIEGSIKERNAVAYCEVKRKGQDAQIRSFSFEQALKANLVNKKGPWEQYPERMLQMRARGFCIRDTFPDALKGLNFAEEVIDYNLSEKKKFENKVNRPILEHDVEETIEKQAEEICEEIDTAKDLLKHSRNIQELRKSFREVNSKFPDHKNDLILVAKQRQTELIQNGLGG